MLQIVPSAGFSPPSSTDYSSDYAVDDFDLPLLPGPMDSAKPFASNNNSIQQFLSLYCDNNSPASVFPSVDTCMTKDPITFYPSYDNFYKKSEPFVYDKSNDWSGYKNLPDSFSAKPVAKNNQAANKNTFLDMDMNDWDCKSDWDDVRVQTSVQSVTSCSSSCASPDFHLPPATPPDFHSILPLDDVKPEVSLNLQNLLNDKTTAAEKAAETKSELLRSILEKSPLENPRSGDDKAEGTDDNHKLLREVLKDTSFQKKYNLRPFDIEGLGTGFQMEAKDKPEKGSLKEEVCDMNLTEGSIAPVLSKAIEQLMQDVDNTSIMLGIPRGKISNNLLLLIFSNNILSSELVMHEDFWIDNSRKVREKSSVLE